ncbi:MAG: hypothetical protein M3032_09365, partial [Verrucomicrobiota bacterium]|nr:hypothetical protein [Verrucomicrobiota bacterium]
CVVLLMLGIIALFVQRPMWLQTIVAHLPLYRSLRWPMRETMVFLFFAHLLVALGWHRLSLRVTRFLPAVSAAVFFVPLFLSASPTFNRFPLDRLLLLSGRAERVWHEVRELMPEAQSCLVVPMAQHNVLGWAGPIFIGQAPHTLLGGYNYPVLFGMKSATGYTMPGFEQKFRDEMPMYGPGYFMPGQFTESDLADPHLLFTRIESLDPVRIEYRIANSVVLATFPNGLSNEPVVIRVR